MTEKPAAEEYVYHIGKIRFIVTPVYKETGELMRDILLKLMLADLERYKTSCVGGTPIFDLCSCMKFLCIIFGCPRGARKWHITGRYAGIATPSTSLTWAVRRGMI